MNEFIIHELVFDSVTITPNPVDTGAHLTISAKVSEVERILEPVYPYSGQTNIYSDSVFYPN